MQNENLCDSEAATCFVCRVSSLQGEGQGTCHWTVQVGAFYCGSTFPLLGATKQS